MSRTQNEEICLVQRLCQRVRKVQVSTVSDFRVGDLKENLLECAAVRVSVVGPKAVQSYHYITKCCEKHVSTYATHYASPPSQM